LEYKNIKVNYEVIVNPIFYYERNETFYYGFDNYSSMPILNPEKILDKFKIVSVERSDGLIITSVYINVNGIIIIDKTTPLGSYNVNITYKNISTIYKFELIPFIFYESKKLIFGDTYSITPEIMIPGCGIFHIQHENLVIDENGIIYNINLLEPNKYKIPIYYNYNNKVYSNYLKLYIKPYINYINKLILLPDQGYLNYDDTIIHVNNFNEVILKTNNIGKYNLNIEYEYNSIKSSININILVATDNLYKFNEYTIYYDETLKIKSLLNEGFFEMKNSVDNIIFNSKGDIYISNMNVGIYYLNISCYINNHIIKNIIKITIKPRLEYITDTIIYGYYKLEPTTIYSIFGKFIFKNNYKNIKYTNNGTIIFNNAYPDNYNFNIDYIFNESIESITFNIKVLPFIKINMTPIIIKFNDCPIINNLSTAPYDGRFIYDLKDITINNNLISIDKNKWIGKYDLNLEYIVNDQSNYTTMQIIIEPTFYYTNNIIELTYYDVLNSEKPYFYPYGGNFSIQYDKNIGNIEIDSETGILKFSNIEMGEFNIKVYYNLSEFNIETEYSIISNPVLKYNNFLTINYQDDYEIVSDMPLYYPKNGQFIIDKLNIDNNGIITFSNLDVNVYNLNIQYIINNKIIKTNYKFIVNPTIIYENHNIDLEYNTENIIESPIVKPEKGFFISNNLPDGFILDSKTGIIKTLILNKIYKINNISKFNTKISDKGEYTITINYIVNNQIASSNLFINII
jgi:hypothetical protein